MATPPPTTNVKKNKRVSNSISSSSSYISDDISFCILSKLPVKSLKRFSCVILNNFIGPDDCSVYLISGDKFEKKVKLELPPSFHLPNFGVIIGSGINGILAIYEWDAGGDLTTTALWNPATHEIMVTPPSLAEFKPEFITCVFPHAFGYDHVGDDYKVIQRVSYYTMSISNENLLDVVTPNPFWEIYSLKSNSWRIIDLDMPLPTNWWTYNVCYFNGVCHWLGKRYKLVSFNLCNEVNFTTPLPLEDNCDFSVTPLVLNGNVAIITNLEGTTTFQISLLGEFGVKESWIRLLDVELEVAKFHKKGGV